MYPEIVEEMMSFKIKKLTKTLSRSSVAKEIAMLIISTIIAPLGEMLVSKLAHRFKCKEYEEILEMSDEELNASPDLKE